MKRSIQAVSLLSLVLASWQSFADDRVVTERTSMTTTRTREYNLGYLRDETVGIKPQIGALVYNDELDNTAARGAFGLVVEANLASAISSGWSDMYVGPSSGFIFSHLGEPSGNFVGGNARTSTGTGGANVAILPVNLKVGYTFTDYFRLSAHGGGNVVYRSMARSLNMGSSSATSDSSWKMFPNVGGDAEFGISKNVSVHVRPDWTITPADTLFSGTVALGVPL